jgi:hypothetical protein
MEAIVQNQKELKAHLPTLLVGFSIELCMVPTIFSGLQLVTFPEYRVLGCSILIGYIIAIVLFVRWIDQAENQHSWALRQPHHPLSRPLLLRSESICEASTVVVLSGALFTILGFICLFAVASMF